MNRLRIAMVVQRYGEEVNGGAELQARWLAEHLLALGDVRVFTTCALDYTTWANHYPAGTTVLNGVTVQRFPVDRPRDWARSEAMTRAVVLGTPTLDEQFAWMRAQGPMSLPLFDQIQQQADDIDVFVFFTYLYATAYFGLPLVAHKSILVPEAHDEPFLYLPLMRPFFHMPRAIAFNTVAERELVNRVVGAGQGVAQHVVGVGINEPPDVDGARFRRKYGIDGDFLLYIGRIAPSKNVPELLADFLRLRSEAQRPLKLVLGGRGDVAIPDHPDIVPLGFISEQDKFDAIDAALAVMIPSRFESLSMIALESWLGQTPVIANGDCDVLRIQCRRSNGGLYYTSYPEFRAVVMRLWDSAELRAQLGRQGRNFVKQNYAWRTILSQYQNIIDALLAETFPHTP